MSLEEALARIGELQQLLTVVVGIWVITVIVLCRTPDGRCDPHCADCKRYRSLPTCPLCWTNHAANERCP